MYKKTLFFVVGALLACAAVAAAAAVPDVVSGVSPLVFDHTAAAMAFAAIPMFGMTTFTEGRHTGEHIISEAAGSRSRDVVTLITGQNLGAGTVVGKIAMAGAAAAAVAGNTGTGAMSAVVVSAGAKLGVYKLTIVEPAANAGTFIVEDPDGINIGAGNVAVAFGAGGLAFTLADAGDFIAGDQFTITVAAGSGKYSALDLASVTGLAAAAAILFDDVDATAADKPAVVHSRDCEVAAADLTWPAGITDNQKLAALAQLAALGIIAR